MDPIRAFLYFLVSIYMSVGAEDSITSYMNHKLPVFPTTNKIFFSDLQVMETLNLNLAYSRAEVFTIFNETFVIVDKDVYHIVKNNSVPKQLFSLRDNVNLVQAVEYKSSGFLVVTTTQETLFIFYSSNSTISFSQIQEIQFESIQQIKFFTNADNLYVTVADLKSSTADITVYKLLESTFDRIDSKGNFGNITFESFGSGTIEYFLILDFPQKLCYMFEFLNERFRKTLAFDAEGALEIITYLYRKKRYVGLVAGNDTVRLYSWTGYKLKFLNEYSRNIKPNSRRIVFYKDGFPFLAAINQGDFDIFSLATTPAFRAIMGIQGDFLSFYETTNATHPVVLILKKTESKQHTIEYQKAELYIDIRKNYTTTYRNSMIDCFSHLEKVIVTSRAKFNERRRKKTKREARKTNFSVFLQNNVSTINLPVFVQNKIIAKKIIVNNIHLNALNNKTWDLNTWLSYSKNQNISGLSAKSIKTHALDVGNGTIFNTLLYSKGDQTVPGLVRIKNLQATGLFTNSINNITVGSIYNMKKPTVIKGFKRFQSLNVKNLTTPIINHAIANETVKVLTNKNLTKYILGDKLRIENLHAGRINGVNVTELYQEVFRLKSDQRINGDLIFENLKANNIIFKTLSGKRILTRTGDQVIKSTINARRIFTRNLEIDTINGHKFNDAAFFGGKITVPVNIYNVLIRNNLEIRGDDDPSQFLKSKTHIIGTNSSDFLQRYQRKVKIKGNLYLKDLEILKPSKFMLNNNVFALNFTQFWNKGLGQQIPVQFEAINGISTSHLLTSVVNDVKIEDFLLDQNRKNKKAKFYFEKVKVMKNVVLGPEHSHSPDFEKITEDSVKLNGNFKIQGQTSYNTLKVDHLIVKTFNNKDVDSLSTPILNLTNVKNLVVKGDAVIKNLTVQSINGINLKELKEKTVYLDDTSKLELNFKNVTVNKLIVKKFKNKKVEDLFRIIEKFENISIIEKVIVKKNVSIGKVKNLVQINDFKMEDLAKKVPRGPSIVIAEKTKFTGVTTVKNLTLSAVHDIDLKKLINRLLFKSWNQKIKGHFTFGTIKSGNLITEAINNLSVKNLVDVSSSTTQTLTAPKVEFQKNIEIKNLNGSINCDLKQALHNVTSPVVQQCDNVVVKGNVTFWDNKSEIYRILTQTVLQHKTQDITGEITFKGHITANNVTTTGLVNDVLLAEIVKDAFINKDDTVQEIRGSKWFAQMNTHSIESHSNINVKLVNNMNITEINEKIVPKNFGSVIRGKKTFYGGLQANYFHTNSSKLPSHHLVTRANSKYIPKVTFENVNVADNLIIENVNKMSFTRLLEKRLLLNGPKQTVHGNYLLRNVRILGNLSTEKLNGISIENIVFDVGTQHIASLKRFTDNLTVAGNVTVHVINSMKLPMLYNKSVCNGRTITFNDSIILKKPIICKGIHTEHLNNVPIKDILGLELKDVIQNEATEIQESMRNISQVIAKYLNYSLDLSNEILYMEKSRDLQLSFSNTTNAQVTPTSTGILLQVQNEENGLMCGLQETCTCRFQQTMEISNKKSINVFTNKGTERVYSFTTDHIIIHFVSNSISSDSYCRANNTKIMDEASSLRWRRFPDGKDPGGFYTYPSYFQGYISDVKFFTMWGQVYIVIGFYYDPVLDTHNVDNLVLQYEKNENVFKEIQRIPSEGMKIVSLFYASQGVVLVLGEDNQGYNSSRTKIFRFNFEHNKFKLIKTLPAYGSIMAVAVVMKSDSLILLVNKESSIQVLKYHPELDNYYFEQMLDMNSTVLSVSVFYANGYGISDPYVNIIMENGLYSVYTFQYMEGFKLKSSRRMSGIRGFIPFSLNKQQYLFVPSSKTSAILALVDHDYT